MTKKTRTVAECLKCGDVLLSVHRHDFKWCSCENIFVDGGADYFRMGFRSKEYKTYNINWEEFLEKVVPSKMTREDYSKVLRGLFKE